ncbi:MAG: hypothetical protein EPN94_00465 [Nitrospirae bacterium]|nr:MAG: hypothetical protein EPN94_00465 [Nitrospirota bacterium]
MIRMITQILLGLMLFFGTATIFPKAIAHLKMKNTGKSILYIFLSLLCALFSILAFHYAYTIFRDIY